MERADADVTSPQDDTGDCGKGYRSFQDAVEIRHRISDFRASGRNEPQFAASMLLSWVSEQVLTGFDEVDGEFLFGPSGDLLVVAAFEEGAEVFGGVEIDAIFSGDAYDEDVLFVGDPDFVVVGDLVVAIEGEAILHIAADAEDGDGGGGGSEGFELLGEGAG